MSCDILICQATGHSLMSTPGGARVVKHEQFAIGLEIVDYPSDRKRRRIAADDWLTQHVEALLDRGGQQHFVLLADHDTTDRFGHHARLIRAEYSLPCSELKMALEGALEGQREAFDDVIAWFWKKSPDLPEAALSALDGLLGTGEPFEEQWEQARAYHSLRRALERLPLINPQLAEDPNFVRIMALLSGDARVTPEEHVRLQEWLDSRTCMLPDTFRQLCQAPVWKLTR